MSTIFGISSSSVANLINFFDTKIFELGNMSTQVPRPIFVDYFSSFAPCCDSVSVDDPCLSTVGNNASECCVSKTTIIS